MPSWPERCSTTTSAVPRFVELGKYLCEVRAGQYCRLENLKSFDEFLERRFPESRRKAYYLMSIHEHLPPQVRRELKEAGWTKGLELAKLARKQGQHFESATWLHRARQMPKAEFQRGIERALNGADSEPSELIYFKVYKSQVPVIEQAIEVAALMLGSDKSRGYCLEMICCRLSRRSTHGRIRSGGVAAVDRAIPSSFPAHSRGPSSRPLARPREKVSDQDVPGPARRGKVLPARREVLVRDSGDVNRALTCRNRRCSTSVSAVRVKLTKSAT